MSDPADAKPQPKEKNRHNWWTIPAVTGAILAVFFAVGYFAYVPPHREYLANRNFRALAVLGDQVQEMVSIHGSTLEYAADLADKARNSPKLRRKEDLGQFLAAKYKALNKTERDQRKDYLRYLAPNFELTEVPVTAPAGSSAKQSRLEVKRRNGKWELMMIAEPHERLNLNYIGRLNLDTVLRPLTTTLPFDDLLLVSEHGTIVFQRERTGPQFTTLSGLLQAQTGNTGKPAGAAEDKPQEPIDDASKVNQNADSQWKTRSIHLTEVTLAGTRYKLFLQPVLVDIFSDEPGETEAPREWILCGLKSAQALEWEALSISSTLVIWCTTVFLIVCLSGPVLKVFLMNHRERFRLPGLGNLAIFLVLITAVITLATLQGIGFPLNDDTEESLALLGDRLSHNIHNELRDMRDQLVSFCGTPEIQADLRAASDTEVIRKPSGEVTGERAIPSHKIYPYFGNVFWTDDDGQQIVKWSSSGYLTPLIDVSHQPLYKHAKTVYLDSKGPPFFFGSAVPPNKLEYLSVMTLRTVDCIPNYAAIGIPPRLAGGSVALAAQSLSLIDPILPYGYGFSLIDQAGITIFQRNKTRNLHENFLQETDWDRDLYGAVYGHGASDSIAIEYMGKDYRAMVMPIAGLSQAPWSLVVYRDLTSVRTMNLEAMTMATMLLLAILALPSLAVGIWCYTKRMHFAPEWLWPNHARKGTYVSLIGIYMVLILVFLPAGFTGPLEENIAACIVIPYAAILFTVWRYRAYPARDGSRKPERQRLTGPGTPAVMAVLAALIFLSTARIRLQAVSGWPVLIGFAFLGAMPMLERPGRYLLLRRARHLRRLTVSRPDPSAEPEHYPWRRYYLASILLPLLLMGVLTPIALFRVGLRVEQRLALKQTELHLATELHNRLLAEEAACEEGELGQEACYSLQDKNSAAWERIVLDPLFSKELPAVPHSHFVPGGDLYSPWLQALVSALHYEFNDASAEMAGLVSDRRARRAPDEPDWHWEDEEKNGRSLLTLRWHGVHFVNGMDANQENDLQLRGALPKLSGLDVFVGASAAAFVMLIMTSLVWVLARKIFLFRIAPLRITGAGQASEAIRNGRSVVVLLPPWSDWKLEEPRRTLRVPELMTSPGWAEKLDVSALPPHTLIELEHFEHETGDEEIDSQKAVLLDRLLRRADTQVAAVLVVPVSAEDYRKAFPDLEVFDLREEPFYWLSRYEGPAREQIWKECAPLPALWPLGLQLSREMRNSDSYSSEAIASEMLERADAYYRMIWNECTEDQKFVLAQLAEDGMLNPANLRAIRQLVRRGLITTEPQFRLLNESFRRFLRSVAHVELRRKWKRESRQSGWGKMHGAFSLTLVFLGLFLFTTQNALWQSSAAYVTTLLAVVGTAGKLLNAFRTGTVPDKADES